MTPAGFEPTLPERKSGVLNHLTKGPQYWYTIAKMGYISPSRFYSRSATTLKNRIYMYQTVYSDIYYQSSGYGSRTHYLLVMSQTFKPFHSPANRDCRIELLLSCGLCFHYTKSLNRIKLLLSGVYVSQLRLMAKALLHRLHAKGTSTRNQPHFPRLLNSTDWTWIFYFYSTIKDLHFLLDSPCVYLISKTYLYLGTMFLLADSVP